ncbi:MAG: hypothetical protein KOO60_03975 [Gemmatimonadales bacterium]|nr:hypothetical protein [Gemmatimonadales bacterium]
MNTPPWEWPQDGVRTILKILGDPSCDQPDRLLAAELTAISTSFNEEIIEALLSIVRDGDESEELRGASAIAFGPALEQVDMEGFDDPDDLDGVSLTEDRFRRIQDVFRLLFQDTSVPKQVRRRVLEASVRAEQDWHSEAVHAAYIGEDQDWRLTAVFAMCFVPGFEEQILESLNSDNPAIHLEAVRAAASWEMDETWSHVVSLAGEGGTEKQLRLAAIEAVAVIRPEEASKVLLELGDFEDEEISAAIEEALTMAELYTRFDLDDEMDGEMDDGRCDSGGGFGPDRDSGKTIH